MHVDANALRRASKVFSTMLFGPFLDAKRTADWTVELPEDDPEALKVIFTAVHGKIGKVPLELKLNTLFQIAVTADKYLMVDALRGPLTSPWTRPSRPGGWSKHDAGGTSYQDLQRLCVVSYFGTKEDLKHILITLICKTWTDPEGKLIFTSTLSSKDKNADPENGWNSHSESSYESDTERNFEENLEKRISEWEEFVPLSQTIIGKSINLVEITR